MDRLVPDIRYAFRMLLRTPAFSLIAIISLALGIGATTSMFSVVEGVVLRPLPYPNSDNLVQIYETDSSLRNGYSGPVSPYNFKDWQTQAVVFEKMAAYRFQSFTYTLNDATDRIPGVMVMPDFFRVLGVEPVMGRDFEPSEGEPGKPHSAILSYGAWQRRFGSDREIINHTISMNGEVYTIVGIMPENFSPFPSSNTEIWALPAYVLEGQNRNNHYLFAVARLKSGVTIREAQSEMGIIAHRLAESYPDTNATSGIQLIHLRDELVGSSKRTVVFLTAAVAIVLVIACANVASLLLGRVFSRRREVAIRMALGASRKIVIKQLLTESALLGVIGGTFGVAVAWWTQPVLMNAFGRFIPRSEGISMNVTVLLFSALVTITCSLVFGIAPALAGSSIELYNAASQRPMSSIGRYSLRHVLVTLEMALALSLMIAAGVLVRSIWLLYQANPGFDGRGVMTFRIDARNALYANPVQRIQLFENTLTRLAMLPGVSKVAAVSDLPFGGSRGSTSFAIENIPYTGPGRSADRSTISPDYFDTMGIPLILGRKFNTADRTDALLVVIVNEALVREYLNSQDPLTEDLTIDNKKYRIVGVVGNVKQDDLSSLDSPQIYLPLNQSNAPKSIFFTIKVQNGSTLQIDTLRRSVKEVAPNEPIYSMRTMNERLANWFAPRRFSITVLSLFTILAISLAAVGLYGLINYFVTQRTHEFGIRLALGATRQDLVALVLRQTGTLMTLACVAGVIISFVVNKLFSSMLFDVKAVDLYIICIAVFLLAVISLCASYIPARRATQVDPLMVLRTE